MIFYKCNCGLITNELFKGCPSCGVESKKTTIKQYDYKKNLEHLNERYLNKISWLEKHITESNQDNNLGIVEGLETILHDIEDMLDELEI